MKPFGRSHSTAALIALFGIALYGCGGPRQQPGPAASDAAAARTPAVVRAAAVTGRIHGVVRLKGSRPEPKFETVPEHTDVCGRQVPVTRLAIDGDNGVGNAFVYLVDAPPSGPLHTETTAVSVTQSKCEYEPHVTAVVAGTQVEIANADPILHNVHAQEMTPDGLRTVFNIAQPIRGQRTLVNVPLTRPGIVTLTCQAGHPWMTAYMLVADNPYTAVTAADGTFTIDGVPPGTYQIRMWHEGVRLRQVFASLQQYEYEEPYVVTQAVQVTAEGDTQADFEFELRDLGPIQTARR